MASGTIPKIAAWPYCGCYMRNKETDLMKSIFKSLLVDETNLCNPGRQLSRSLLPQKGDEIAKKSNGVSKEGHQLNNYIFILNIILLYIFLYNIF